MILFGFDTKSKVKKSKNKQTGLHQIKNICTAKTTYEIGENIYKPHI